MNLFAQQIKFEDTEGLEFPGGQLITEGDEGESVAAAVAEVTEEEAGVAEDERGMDQLADDEETLSEVQEVVEQDAPKMEHAGLTPTGARLAKIILKRVVGARHADKTIPKMEHFESRSDARDATSFVVEGVGEALKSFWEALKAQFKKLWAKVKTWYIKTFSAAKTLAERAKTIRDRAESSTSTIEKKTFQFGQVKQLVVGGRLKDVSAFESALSNVTQMVEETHTIETDAAIDSLSDNLDKLVTRSDADAIGGLKRVVGPQLISTLRGLKEGSQNADDRVVASLGGGDAGDARIATSEVLPGDRVFVIITSKETTDLTKALRMTRIDIVNTKNKPKEISGDVEVVTLNTSQIAKFCDMIATSAGDIADYEQKWQKTDRAQEKVLKAIDDLVRNGNQNIKDDENADSKAERELRTVASAATNFIKRMGGMQAKVAGFAMPVYAATLNWCEGSMRNYKK